MKKIIITGASGLLGGRLIEYFAGLGYLVIGLSSKVNLTSSWANVTYVTKNLMNPDGLESIFYDADYIIHASGINALESSQNPLLAYDFNYNSTLNICRAIRSINTAKLLYVSTAHVYRSPLVGYIDEKTCPTNKHPYALSHLAAESILTTLNEDRVRGIIVRLSNSYGFPSNPDANCWMLFVNDIAKQLVHNGEFKIQSNSSQVRDFVPISYFLNAVNHLLNLHHEKMGDGVFNIGSGVPFTLKEMSQRIADRYIKVLNERNYQSLNFNERPINQEALQYSTHKLLETGYHKLTDEIINAEIDNLLFFCKNLLKQ